VSQSSSLPLVYPFVNQRFRSSDDPCVHDSGQPLADAAELLHEKGPVAALPSPHPVRVSSV